MAVVATAFPSRMADDAARETPGLAFADDTRRRVVAGYLLPCIVTARSLWPVGVLDVDSVETIKNPALMRDFFVTLLRLERRTYCLEGSCSIQLSYGAICVSECLSI